MAIEPKFEKTIKFNLSKLEELLTTIKEYITDADRHIGWEVTREGIRFIDKATNITVLFESEIDWDKPPCPECDHYTRCTHKDRDCIFNPFID
jgi:hypothetical protein